MPVRDICDGDPAEVFRDPRSLCRVTDLPDPVADAVVGYEIIERRLLLCLRHDCLQIRITPVCKEDGAGLGAADVHVPDAVLLLFLPCVLMLPDDIVQIVVHRGAGNYACLTAARHDLHKGAGLDCLLINIEGGRLVLHEGTVSDLRLQHVPGLLISLVGIHVEVVAELGLRAVDVQEGKRVPLHCLLRFFSVIYVVRQRSHPAHHVRVRADTAECLYFCHK